MYTITKVFNVINNPMRMLFRYDRFGSSALKILVRAFSDPKQPFLRFLYFILLCKPQKRLLGAEKSRIMKIYEERFYIWKIEYTVCYKIENIAGK